MTKTESNGCQAPVARVAEVHMGRCTIEWVDGPLPEGAELFAAPVVQPGCDPSNCEGCGPTPAPVECRRCDGSGEIMVMQGRGPDTWEEPACCDKCNGTGAVEFKSDPLAIPASSTTGMNLAQYILHVGGRNNAAGYVEFGSIQAVKALVHHVLRDALAEERDLAALIRRRIV